MQHHETVWVVVEVWRGIPIAADIFRDREKAVDYEQSVRARINLMEDETGLFEAELEPASAHSGPNVIKPPSQLPD
jgi:hypothetical protein